ncbi:hypothetical protein BGX34_003139 [Mortierella sp. NVP85]|nr:hypothetical protein BGX34_003139 [Mortierella sp. NVP85]
MEHVGIRPCTPPHLRPRVGLSKLSSEAVPALKFRSNFLQTVKPKWWTLEGYFEHGYLDVDDYLHDLALFSRFSASGPQVILMQKHCQAQIKFYETEDGKMLLRLMKADHTARMENQVAILNAMIAGFRGQNERPEGVPVISGEAKGRQPPHQNMDRMLNGHKTSSRGVAASVGARAASERAMVVDGDMP